MLLLLAACSPPRPLKPDPADSARPADSASDTAPRDTASDTAPHDTSVADVPMIVPPLGTFRMGSPDDEVGRTADETAHDVTLTRAYAIGTHEITLAAFEARLGYVPAGDTLCGDPCPVRWVDWHEAAAFANALSLEVGLVACYTCTDGACVPVSGCDGYRLPTEAEWEHAARAGESAAFHAGGGLAAGTEQSCEGDVTLDDGTRLDDIAWYCGNSGSNLQIAGTRAPNAWGMHDTAGNVYEWVEDWFAAFDASPATDPTGPADGTARVHKGGGWGSTPDKCRPANRAPTEPTFTSGGLGFRVARTLP